MRVPDNSLLQFKVFKDAGGILSARTDISALPELRYISDCAFPAMFLPKIDFNSLNDDFIFSLRNRR
jgi:hypothetical protein